MNTLDQNLISSCVVIHRIIEDYDVHSMDFMTRIPTWICEALADLNIQQHLINVGKVIDFDEYRCEIPEGCENIRLVTINGKRAEIVCMKSKMTFSVRFIPIGNEMASGI